MTVTRSRQVSESSRSRAYQTEAARLAVAADRARRAAKKQRDRECKKRHRAEKRHQEQATRMATLVRLLDEVLQLEPWNLEFHDRKMGEAWRECGRRVPGYLKGGGRTEAGVLVQRKVVRMGHQLMDPKVKTLWKSNTEVTRRLEKIVANLATTRSYKDKFGVDQHKGPVEPENVDVGV